MAELCKKFMEDYSKKRNKPSTQDGYQGVIDRNIIPLLGRKKVHDVKRPDIAGLMEKLAYKPTEANKTFGVLRKMFNLAEVWGYRPDGTNPCRHVPMYPPGKETRLIVDEEMVRIFRQLRSWRRRGWRTTSSRWRSGCNSSSPPGAPKSARSNGAGWTSRTGAWCGPTARSAAFPSP